MRQVKRRRSEDDTSIGAVDLAVYGFDGSKGVRTTQAHLAPPEGDEAHRNVMQEALHRTELPGGPGWNGDKLRDAEWRAPFCADVE